MSILRKNTFLPYCKECLEEAKEIYDIKKLQKKMTDGDRVYSVLTLITHFINSFKLLESDEFKEIFRQNSIFEKMQINNSPDPINYLCHEINASDSIEVFFNDIKDFFLHVVNYLQIFFLENIYISLKITAEYSNQLNKICEEDLKLSEEIILKLYSIIKKNNFNKIEYNKLLNKLDKIINDINLKQISTNLEMRI